MTISSVYEPPQGTWSPDKQGRQRARELMESGSLNFKAASLGNVPRATKPRPPEKQGSRSLNFELLSSSGAELLRSWTGELALGKGGKHRKKVRFS